jgi:hypothetical protein
MNASQAHKHPPAHSAGDTAHAHLKLCLTLTTTHCQHDVVLLHPFVHNQQALSKDWRAMLMDDQRKQAYEEARTAAGPAATHLLPQQATYGASIL